jgi:hypothetical protein
MEHSCASHAYGSHRRRAPRADRSARVGSWVTPVMGARLLADDTVSDVGELPSIRVRRCAPQRSLLAMADTSRLVRSGSRTDGSVFVAGELHSIRVRRCAPRLGCLARG